MHSTTTSSISSTTSTRYTRFYALFISDFHSALGAGFSKLCTTLSTSANLPLLLLSLVTTSLLLSYGLAIYCCMRIVHFHSAPT
ncbi:hypothetical protein GQ54DRAFT_296556 [Martensiomyces pterosporus]|nr:hypothetical protein GQ54DRAFT_296556 [Martensiomyces pterosporus]